MADDQEIGSSLVAPPPSPDVPQFSTAEYAHIPGTERCRICGYPAIGEYFRINGQMACAKCGAQARDGQPHDSHAAFLRALLLGAGAAVISLIAYAAFTILTSLYIGVMALAVGWFVGKAMMKGSNGMGGKRYQITAVLLTYFAISVAEIPIWIASSYKQPTSHPVPAQQAAGSASEASPALDNTPSSSPSAAEPAPKAQPGLVKLLVQLLFIGLASPFLELRDPVHGIIGLVILFVGLRIAYSMTASKPLEVDGPYPLTA